MSIMYLRTICPSDKAMTLYLLNKVVLQLSNKNDFSQRCAEIACKIKIILFFFLNYMILPVSAKCHISGKRDVALNC